MLPWQSAHPRVHYRVGKDEKSTTRRTMKSTNTHVTHAIWLHGNPNELKAPMAATDAVATSSTGRGKPKQTESNQRVNCSNKFVTKMSTYREKAKLSMASC